MLTLNVVVGGLKLGVGRLLRTYGHQAISRKAAALGYHWLTDLMAGTIVGLLIALGVTRLDTRKFHPSSNGTSSNATLPTPG